MTNFMLISIVVTTLFVMTVLVVDHIERSRHARLTQNAHLQQWKKAYDEDHSLDAYLNGIGYQDATIEEIAMAQKQQENIVKILKTM